MGSADEAKDWIRRLGEGDEQAAEEFLELNFEDLLRFIRSRLRRAPLSEVGSMDIAQTAFADFFAAVKAGRIPTSQHEEASRALLFRIAKCKLIKYLRRKNAQKRRSRRVAGESIFDGIPGGEPGPDFGTLVEEICEEISRQLDEKSLQVFLLKLEDYSNTDIAEKLGCDRRTVIRKVNRLKEVFVQMGLNPQ
jgi:RNA polymerase sigma factor (sigma-70 family)